VSVEGSTGGAGTANLGAVTMVAGSELTAQGTNAAITVATLNGAGSVNVAGGNLQVTNGLFDGTTTGGTLEESGGSFTLDGTADLSSGTSISNGTLVVGDSAGSSALLTGPVTVSSSGILQGYGTLSGAVANNGTVQPGLAGTGSLTVGGFSQGGSGELYLSLLPSQGSQLNVTGTAQWGGTLYLQAALGPDNLIRYRYDLLNVGGGMSGSFAATVFNNLPAVMDPVWSGTSNAVTLTLYRGGVDFTSFATTPNGTAVGTAMNQSIPTATNDFIAKISELYFLPSGQGPLLDQMGGIIYTALPGVMLDNLQFEDDLLFSRLDSSTGSGPGQGMASPKAALVGGLISSEVSGPAAQAQGLSSAQAPGFWLQSSDGFGSVAATNDVIGFNKSNVGFLAGYDSPLSPGLTGGIMGGYLHTNVTSTDSTEQAGVDGYQFGVYGRRAFGNFDISLLGGYVIDHFNVTRTITLGTDVNQLAGLFDGNQINGALQFDYRLVDVDTTIKPIIGLQYAHLTENAFTETGSDSINLAIPAQSYDSLRPYLGLGENWSLGVGKGAILIPQVQVTVSQELINTSATQIQTAFQGATIDPFTVTGTTPDGTDFGVGAGAQLTLDKALNFFVNYNGHFSGSQSLNTFNGGVNLAF
jgi:uncharacterized protein with beta-barrel porin domain